MQFVRNYYYQLKSFILSPLYTLSSLGQILLRQTKYVKFELQSMKYLIVFIALCFIVTAKKNSIEMGLQNVPVPVPPAFEAQSATNSQIVPSLQKTQNSGNRAAHQKARQKKKKAHPKAQQRIQLLKKEQIAQKNLTQAKVANQEPKPQIKSKAVPAVVTQNNSTKISNLKSEAKRKVPKQQTNKTIIKSEQKSQQTVNKQMKTQEVKQSVTKRQSLKPSSELPMAKSSKNISNNNIQIKQLTNKTNSQAENILKAPKKQESKKQQTINPQVQDKNEEKIAQKSQNSQLKAGISNKSDDGNLSPAPILVKQQKKIEKKISQDQKLKEAKISQPKVQSEDKQILVNEHEQQVEKVSKTIKSTQIDKIQPKQQPKTPLLQSTKQQLKQKIAQINNKQTKVQISQSIIKDTVKQILSPEIKQNVKIQENSTNKNALSQRDFQEDKQNQVKIEKNVTDAQQNMNNDNIKSVNQQQQSQEKEIANKAPQQQLVQEKVSKPKPQIIEENNKTLQLIQKNQIVDKKIFINSNNQEQIAKVQSQTVKPKIQSKQVDKVDDIKIESKEETEPPKIVAKVQPSENLNDDSKESEKLQKLIETPKEQLKKTKQAEKQQNVKTIEPIVQGKTSQNNQNQQTNAVQSKKLVEEKQQIKEPKPVQPINKQSQKIDKIQQVVKSQVKEVKPINVENKQSPKPIIIDTQPAKDETENKQSQSNLINEVQKLKGQQLPLKTSTKIIQQQKQTETTDKPIHLSSVKKQKQLQTKTVEKEQIKKQENIKAEKTKIIDKVLQKQASSQKQKKEESDNPKPLQPILVVKSNKKQDDRQSHIQKQDKIEQTKPKLKLSETNRAETKKQVSKFDIPEKKKQLSTQQDEVQYQKKASRINNKPSREKDDNLIIVALVAATCLLIIFFILRSLKSKSALYQQGGSSHNMFREDEDFNLSGPEIAERLQD